MTINICIIHINMHKSAQVCIFEGMLYSLDVVAHISMSVNIGFIDKSASECICISVFIQVYAYGAL